MQLPPNNVFSLLASILLIAISANQLEAKKRVAVKSYATKDFIELREKNDFAPMSYVFGQGEMFGSSTRGNSIAKIKFHDIAKTLATDLAEQSFFPAPDAENADLLLIVHWGGIEKLEDPTRFLALEKVFEDLQRANSPQATEFDAFDPLEGRFDLLGNEASRMQEIMSTARIARLLGFDEDLEREREKPVASSLEETLLTYMQQERFLVIVMAWDYELLRRNEGKKLLWSAHMSMKALGTDFEDAISFMSGAAVGQFGIQTDRVSSHVFKRDEYKIEMGELEVVESGESVEEETPKGSKKQNRAKGK